MENMPKVSVIIPIYNAAEFLGDAWTAFLHRHLQI